MSRHLSIGVLFGGGEGGHVGGLCRARVVGEYLRVLLFHCGECVSDELGYGVLEECVAGLLQGWAWAFTDPV